MTDSLQERRKIQRDWFGHGLQLFGILVLLGIPILLWGISINTSLATLVTRIDRNEKDITQQQQVQTLITNQLIGTKEQLVKIDTLLGEFRRDFRSNKH